MNKMQLPDQIGVYWINLASSEKRKKRMQQKIDAVGWRHIAQRIVATEPKDIRNLVIANSIPETPEVACTISHLRAIRAAKLANLKAAIVFEDDVNFQLVQFWNATLQSILAKASEKFPDYTVLFLSWSSPSKRMHESLLKKNIFQKKMFVDHRGRVCGAFAYVVSQKGIETIIKRHWDAEMKKCSIEPGLCIADKLLPSSGRTILSTVPLLGYDAEDSTIHESHLSMHRLNLKWIEEAIGRQDLVWATETSNA